MDEIMFVYFVDVDENGNITGSMCGERVIPDKQYDFFFYRDPSYADTLHEYRVELNGYKAELVRK